MEKQRITSIDYRSDNTILVKYIDGHIEKYRDPLPQNIIDNFIKNINEPRFPSLLA